MTRDLNILRVIRPDYIIPSFDRDQLLFYPSNPELRSLGIESLGPDYPILDSIRIKLRSMNFCEKTVTQSLKPMSKTRYLMERVFS